MPLFCCKRKGQLEKIEGKILKTLETVTRLVEPAKGFLAKATPNTPDKEQIVFVPIHQKTGFVDVNLLYP